MATASDRYSPPRRSLIRDQPAETTPAVRGDPPRPPDATQKDPVTWFSLCRPSASSPNFFWPPRLLLSMDSPPNLSHLASLAAGGDEAAAEALVRQLTPVVVRTARLVVGPG